MFKKVFTQNFLYSLLWKAFIIFFIIASISIIPLPPSLHQYNDAINRYDAQNYLDICNKGYDFPEQPYPARILRFSFYPGLPLLDCMGTALQIEIFPIILNVVLFLYMVISLELYLRLMYSDIKLRNYIFWTYVIFPFSFFFHLNYTEALFIGLTFNSLYFLEKNKVIKSNLVGLITGFIRPTALTLAIVMWVKYSVNFLKTTKLNIQNLFTYLTKSLTFLLYGFGTLALFLFFKLTYGNFFLFFDSENKFYGRRSSLSFVKNTLDDILGREKWFDKMDQYLNNNVYHFGFYDKTFTHAFLLYFPLIVIIIATIYMIYKKKWYYLFFSWFMILLPLSQDTVSLNRYLLQSFPFLFMFAELCYKNKYTRSLLLFFYIIGFLLCVILYTHGYWVG